MSGPGNGGLEADRHEIEQFYNLLFCYADDDTFMSLRIFDQFDRTKPALHIEGIILSGNADAIIAAACRVATRAATATEPAVFAPPLATFATIARARGEDGPKIHAHTPFGKWSVQISVVRAQRSPSVRADAS